MRLPALVLTLILALPVAAQEPTRKPDPVRQGPRVIRPAEAGVGKMIPDVAFTDLAGKAGKLSDFKDAKLTVVAFTNTTCPICKKYAPSLARIEKEYAAKGVAFLFVNPTATDKPDAVRLRRAVRPRHRRHADRRVRRDRDHGGLRPRPGAHGASIAARSTTSTVSAIRSMHRERSTSRPALDAALAGKLPVVAATDAPGCALEPDAAKAPASGADVPRPDRADRADPLRGVPPQGRSRAVRARDVRGGRGPQGDDPQGGRHGARCRRGSPPAKERRSPRRSPTTARSHRGDKKDLLAWLAGDLQEGRPGRCASAAQLFAAAGSSASRTRFSASRSRSRSRPRASWLTSTDEVRDRFRRGPVGAGDSRSSRPPARSFTTCSCSRYRRARRIGENRGGFFAAYVPGNTHLIYPEGYAKKLPKGSTLVFQIHYTPNGKATTDQTRHRAGVRHGSAATRDPHGGARQHARSRFRPARTTTR